MRLPTFAVVCVYLVVCLHTGQAHSYLTEEQERAKFNLSSFVWNFTNKVYHLGNSHVTSLELQDNQALGTLPNGGSGQRNAVFQPCTLLQPHVHPRGNKFAHVLYGKFLFALAEENGGRTFSQVATAGQTVVIPQGLLHSFHNDFCEPAAFVDFYATSDPGIQTAWSALIKMPDSIILASTGMSAEQLLDLRENFPGGPFSYDYECALRCNITDIKSSPSAPPPGAAPYPSDTGA